MSARFGRNKRRAAREEISEATAALSAANRRVASLSLQVADAEERGMRRLLNDPERIDYAMKEISHELGRALPAEILPYAEKLMRAHSRGRAPVRFEARIPIDSMASTVDIQGRIDLHFELRVDP